MVNCTSFLQTFLLEVWTQTGQKARPWLCTFGDKFNSSAENLSSGAYHWWLRWYFLETGKFCKIKTFVSWWKIGKFYIISIDFFALGLNTNRTESRPWLCIFGDKIQFRCRKFEFWCMPLILEMRFVDEEKFCKTRRRTLSVGQKRANGTLFLWTFLL